MNIQFETESPSLGTIKITINETDYQSELEKKIKEYAKQVVLKGFRPGKVPSGLIQKMYGKAILAEEIQKILSQSLDKYIEEQAIQIIGNPIPHPDTPKIDFEKHKEFDFWFKLGLVPPFEVDLENITATKYNVTISDELLKEQIERIKSNNSPMEDVEISEAEDYLIGFLHISEDSHHYTDENQEEEKEHFHYDIAIPLSQVVEEEIPRLIGLKSGDKVLINVQKIFKNGIKGLIFSTGISEEEAEKMEGEYELNITQVQRKVPKELDDADYKRLFPNDNITTKEQFLEKSKEKMIETNENDSWFLVDKQVKEQLLKNTSIELSVEFLKDWLLFVNKDEISLEEIEKEFDYFLETLRADLIFSKLQKELSIELQADEILKMARKFLFGQFGLSNLDIIEQQPELKEKMDKMVMDYLQKDEGRNYQTVIKSALEEKVLKSLRSEVQLTEAEVSNDEFVKLFD